MGFKSNDSFLNIILKFTWEYWPVADFTILEILDLPSNVDKPIVSPALLMATDWSKLFLPKSAESRIVLLLALLISTIPIF